MLTVRSGPGAAASHEGSHAMAHGDQAGAEPAQHGAHATPAAAPRIAPMAVLSFVALACGVAVALGLGANGWSLWR
jgi:hypothetical protein